MDKENMTIRIITEEAKEIEASIISIFEIKEIGNKYAIYTFNEEDAQGLVKIYASKISEQDGSYVFESIGEASEWTKIKDVMKDTAKEKSSYIENGDISLISAKMIKSKMNEPISVKLSETKAAKIGPNYKTGITNNYLNNVKDETPSDGGQQAEPVQPQVETPQPEVSVETPSEPVTVQQPEVEVPTEETQPQNLTPTETPEVEQPVSVEPLPHVEEPEVAPEVKVEEPKVTVVPTPTFEMPKVEEKEEEPIKVDLPEEKDDSEEDSYSYDEEQTIEKEPINVDSILNKASYFQNLEEEPKKEEKDDNIIQSIGLEFMRKVSELAEYEKELNKKNREMEAREKVLSKVEKEMISKEKQQKTLLQASRDRELELKRKDRELADKEADLNRRIMEFNKKISMFQQTFESMSKVD